MVSLDTKARVAGQVPRELIKGDRGFGGNNGQRERKE